MPRLEFKVIQCTGEDPDYPSDSLNEHGPNAKGWQTPRFCEYPQELVLEFLAGDEEFYQNVRKMEVAWDIPKNGILYDPTARS